MKKAVSAVFAIALLLSAAPVFGEGPQTYFLNEITGELKTGLSWGELKDPHQIVDQNGINLGLVEGSYPSSKLYCPAVFRFRLFPKKEDGTYDLKVSNGPLSCPYPIDMMPLKLEMLNGSTMVRRDKRIEFIRGE